MYLSQLTLNSKSALVMRDLANSYDLHRRIMSGFPRNLLQEERILYRLEVNRREPVLAILVQSSVLPDWYDLSSKNYLLFPAEIKQFNFHFQPEQILRFRLTANPTKRLKNDGKTDGARVGLLREEDQIKWLDRKGNLGGFSVLEVSASKIVNPDGIKEMNGKKHHIRCTQVCFNGLLRITDTVKFQQVCISGIGSGKSFGCGLLSIAPA